MPSVGVRELKNRASEILRDVTDNGAEYTVTRDGTPIATLAAIPREDDSELEREWDEFFEALDRISGELEKVWPAGLTAADAVAEQRR